jgi:hypothetical protein
MTIQPSRPEAGSGLYTGPTESSFKEISKGGAQPSEKGDDEKVSTEVEKIITYATLDRVLEIVLKIDQSVVLKRISKEASEELIKELYKKLIKAATINMADSISRMISDSVTLKRISQETGDGLISQMYKNIADKTV